MDPSNGDRRLLRRMGLAVLLGYTGVLILSAWPKPLKPSFLRAPVGLARRALASLGITAGQAVFDFPEVRDWFEVAYCLHARGERRDAEPLELWPPGGSCKTSGFRWRLPPRDTAYLRLLRIAGRRANAGHLEEADEVLSGLGRQLCSETTRAGEPAQSIRLVWYAWARSYERGETRREMLVRSRWDCRRSRLQATRWLPEEADVIRFWKGTPWQ